MTACPKRKSCYSEKKNKKTNKISSELFFFFTKNDKDEFNTILKHLIKLVKNFKTHCYFFFFSNISHLATFFFLFTCTSGVGTKGRWAGLQVGAVLTDQEEEELKGEVSIFDLYSSVTSWGHVKRVTLSSRAPPVEDMERFSVFSLFVWRATRAVNTVSTHLLVCVFPHWIRLHENHMTKNKKNVKKNKQRKQGTAAKYTHKRDPFWWYLQSLCEKERRDRKSVV